jgi:hypothetical protein
MMPAMPEILFGKGSLMGAVMVMPDNAGTIPCVSGRKLNSTPTYYLALF